MKKSSVRYIALLILMLMIALNAAAPMNAAGYLDISKPVTLTVNFRPEEISATDVKFELFKVANVDEYAELTLTDSFKDIPIDLAVSDSSVWADAVNEAESCVSSRSLTANYSAVTDENGNAVFSNVAAGLYLLRGESFIINHDVYRPQSYLIMLPNRADDSSWEYEVNSIPKFEKSDEIIDLKVSKKWEGGSVADRPKEVIVSLFCDDVEYQTVRLSADNNWQYTWPDLNAKHNWVISEIKVEGYITTIENDGYNYIIVNKSTAEPPEETDDKLPQTGMVWWHVPLIAAAGIIFCIIGLLIIKKYSETA